MKLLLVGDMHVKKDNLLESERLMTWIVNTSRQSAIDAIVFLGDQYNFMGIAHVEVVEFWHKWFKEIAQNNLKSYSLIGNHDINADATASAMIAHNVLTKTVGSEGCLLSTGECFLGYIRNNSDFIKKVNDFYHKGARTLFCHAEFNGAKYENGFYAPHGIDIESLPKDIKIISGHIHMNQEFGNIWYPGTPRHLTRSDIGQEKGIWLYDTETKQRHFIKSPDDICVPFKEIVLKEGDAIPEDLHISEKVYVDIHGSLDYIKSIVGKLPDTVKIRSFPVSEAKKLEIKESEGIPTAFLKYANGYMNSKELTDLDKADVLKEIKRLCPSLFNGIAQ